MRYILEGEWSVYHSGQRHVVHKTILSNLQFKKINEQKLSYIRYSDGTYLSLRVIGLKSRERIKEIHGYDSLINDCLFYQCNSVDELIKKRPNK